jgi:hypothetical protein
VWIRLREPPEKARGTRIPGTPKRVMNNFFPLGLESIVTNRTSGTREKFGGKAKKVKEK